MDSKCVIFLSTYLGVEPITKISRYNRKTKMRELISCPNVIIEYNKHMGGVDLQDSMLGRFKINMKSHKYYLRLFYHLLDMTVVNSWTLYRRAYLQKNKVTNKNEIN